MKLEVFEGKTKEEAKAKALESLKITEEEAYIKSSKPTKKQMSYLENLAKKNGFQLCNSEYLSKNYAASLIEYLNEQTGVEPVIFDFFTTAI